MQLPATVLLREIRAQGYEGGITQLKEYLREVRPAPPPEPIVRFETKRGSQLQIDFVVLRRGALPLRAFTAELGYSRYAYVEFTDNERSSTLIACLENALHYFGGVPSHVLCDNPKTIVVERNAYGEGRHRFHAGWLDFVKHYGLGVKLCAPYRAREPRARIERFHRYLRSTSARCDLQSAARQNNARAARSRRCCNREVQRLADRRRQAAAVGGKIERTPHSRTLSLRPIDRFVTERQSLRAVDQLPYAGYRSHDQGSAVAQIARAMRTPPEMRRVESFQRIDAFGLLNWRELKRRSPYDCAAISSASTISASDSLWERWQHSCHTLPKRPCAENGATRSSSSGCFKPSSASGKSAAAFC